MRATSSLKFEAALAPPLPPPPPPQPCTCPVCLLMWQSPEPPAHWLTVWASDLTHLGPPWLGLLCLCVQTSAPVYCTVPDWAALACCRDGRAHVPVMNGGLLRSGKLAACYTEKKGDAGEEEPCCASLLAVIMQQTVESSDGKIAVFLVTFVL